MHERWIDDDYMVIKEKIVPIKVKNFRDVQGAEELLTAKTASISFGENHVTKFTKKGSFVHEKIVYKTLHLQKNVVEDFWFFGII